VLSTSGSHVEGRGEGVDLGLLLLLYSRYRSLRLKLNDTRVYEPQIRADLETTDLLPIQHTPRCERHLTSMPLSTRCFFSKNRTRNGVKGEAEVHTSLAAILVAFADGSLVGVAAIQSEKPPRLPANKEESTNSESLIPNSIFRFGFQAWLLSDFEPIQTKKMANPHPLFGSLRRAR